MLTLLTQLSRSMLGFQNISNHNLTRSNGASLFLAGVALLVYSIRFTIRDKLLNLETLKTLATSITVA